VSFFFAPPVELEKRQTMNTNTLPKDSRIDVIFARFPSQSSGFDWVLVCKNKLEYKITDDAITEACVNITEHFCAATAIHETFYLGVK
jgi:hypothetical protein